MQEVEMRHIQLSGSNIIIFLKFYIFISF